MDQTEHVSLRKETKHIAALNMQFLLEKIKNEN